MNAKQTLSFFGCKDTQEFKRKLRPIKGRTDLAEIIRKGVAIIISIDEGKALVNGGDEVDFEIKTVTTRDGYEFQRLVANSEKVDWFD